MAEVFNYTFDNISRIGADKCCIDQTTIQNVESCNYTLQNYFAKDCSMKKPIALATTQPGVFYSGGHGTGAGGCNFDTNSTLLIGSIQTHPRCHIDLFQRPFATVPFLGRGSANPILESQIQQGEMVENKRSVSKLAERSHIKYHAYPLLPQIKQTIANPSNFVESSASDSWVRGGVPSRDLTRDRDFFGHHTENQYV